jgi:branched-chain amino acid transport system ATP-binding protein
LDEPTAGVSPIVMDEIFSNILDVRNAGMAVLMVEQNAQQALNIADKGFVLVSGRNEHTGTQARSLSMTVKFERNFWEVRCQTRLISLTHSPY